MPTFYTEIIHSRPDVPFRTFAIRCAHAMGACFDQRDAPLDGQLEMDEVEPYYYEALNKAEWKLAELKQMADDELEEFFAEQRQARIERIIERMGRLRQIRDAYVRLRAEVEKWTPPTAEHCTLKTFMLDQLDADGSGEQIEFCEVLLAAEKLPFDFISERRTREQELRKRVMDADESLQKEIKRVNANNLWKQQLLDGLT